MNLDFNLAQLSAEQLLELVRQLIAENEQLQAENAQLRAEIEELKRKNARPAAPFSKNKRKKNPKRPGRKPGQGPFNNRPAPPEESYSAPPVDVPVTETNCPECGGELGEETEDIVTNTEIPPAPKPDVKAYRVKIRACRRRQRKVRGRHPEIAPDQSGATAHRLGSRAQAAAHALHYGEGVPQRKVPGVLRCLTGLKVTQGAITQSAIRLGTCQGPIARHYEKSREKIKEQETIHTDDTGWRVGGEPAQLMVFESEPVVVYQIRARHRNEEVHEVIGDNYQGTLSTDRGRSYDAKELQEVKQQKCLSHILRSIDAVLETQSGRSRQFGFVLKTQLQDAIKLYKAFHDPEKKLPDYARRVGALEEEVTYHSRLRLLKDQDNQRLLNEIGRHHDRGNLPRFLHEPTSVEPTNNAAERALRPAAIARKVSHCSKNELSAAAFSASLRSLAATAGPAASPGARTLYIHTPPTPSVGVDVAHLLSPADAGLRLIPFGRILTFLSAWQPGQIDVDQQHGGAEVMAEGETVPLSDCIHRQYHLRHVGGRAGVESRLHDRLIGAGIPAEGSLQGGI